MGAWGTGPFDNDAAADFLGELQTAPARSVKNALRAISKLPAGEYLDVDAGSAGWAACELVALSFGYGNASALDDAVLDVVGRLKPKEEQRSLALGVVQRIAQRGTSELADLWYEGDAGPRFDDLMTDLSSRLGAASAGPRTLPRPKRGDLIYVPDSPDSTGGVVVQVVAAGEVAVFEGRVADETAALEAVGSRPARRLPTAVNKLLRRGHLVGNVSLRRDLKGKKLYAGEAGAIEEYILATASAGGVKMVSYDQARDCDVLRPYDLDGIRAVAAGMLPPERVRSPAEREAELRRRHDARWAERRQLTSPGPFGDPASLERLLGWIEDYGVENAVQRFHDLACGMQGYGRPNEEAERRPYAFAGLVAIWRGTWPTSDWPEGLATRLPAAPDEQLFATALAAARTLVEQVLSRDSELRLIWDGAPDGGASFRRALERLEKALQ